MGAADEFDLGGASALPDKMDALNAALEEAVALEQTVAQMEEDLKAVKKSLNALKGSRIPDLMGELQMESVVFRGWQVRIDDFVSGSLPREGEGHEQAVRWLEEHGAGGLIKTDLTLAFGKSQHNEALDLAGRLEAEGLAPSVKSGVHAQTLHAFARERIRNGEPLDIEILGLYIGKVAKMKQVQK